MDKDNHVGKDNRANRSAPTIHLPIICLRDMPSVIINMVVVDLLPPKQRRDLWQQVSSYFRLYSLSFHPQYSYPSSAALG